MLFPILKMHENDKKCGEKDMEAQNRKIWN